MRIRNNTFKKSNEEAHEWGRLILNLLFSAGVIVLVINQFGKAWDIQDQRQQEMICETALISGNTQKQSECQCYYEGENITCIR
jgi:hypothetical protein